MFYALTIFVGILITRTIYVYANAAYSLILHLLHAIKKLLKLFHYYQLRV